MTRKVLWRWVITCFVGIITGLLAFVVQTSYTKLSELKFEWISQRNQTIFNLFWPKCFIHRSC